MLKKKNKPHGHYCRICGTYKSNEKFSGRGHASHICKACHSLPAERRNELENLNKIDRIQENFFISKENLKRLKKYAGDKRYPESSQYAKNALDNFYARMDEYHGNTSKGSAEPVVFSELNNELKKAVYELLYEFFGEFFGYSDFLPDNDDIKEILTMLYDEISESLNYYEPKPYNADKYYGGEFQSDEEDYDAREEPENEIIPQKKLVINNELREVFKDVLNKVSAEFKADGVEFISLLDSLTVTETERLNIREFIISDLTALHKIMKKPGVMYAWGHGFNKNEVKAWINNQTARYDENGYGYYAVTLKESGKLIGQVGLVKTNINGENVTELGYIFDNAVLGKGYCDEAARACIDMAFGKFELDKLYCAVRPENEPSVKVAERLGFIRIGEFVKVYREKEMPHIIYVLNR